MKNYLQSKKIEFQDERLNVCINLIASSIVGRSKIKFLLKHLTPESVEAINSKHYIKDVPANYGATIECGLVRQEDDPSCSNTAYDITIVKGGKYYSFEFHIGKFHKNMHELEEFFVYSEYTYKPNKYGEPEIEFNFRKDVAMSVVNSFFSTVFTPQGLYTNLNLNYTFPIIKPQGAERLFRDISKDLLIRENYRNLDTETLKTVYPNMYRFFQTIYNKGVAKDKIESLKILDDAYEKVFSSIADKQERESVITAARFKALDVGCEAALDNGIDKRHFNEWRKENGLKDIEPIQYEVWISQSSKFEVETPKESVYETSVEKQTSQSNASKILDYLNFAKDENSDCMDD